MILHREDWLKYPGAIVHKSTKNHTWLRLAGIYYKMGIKNNMFHLSLLDPSLEHVDPHSPNISDTDKEKVMIESIRNPWYFFREVVRVPPPAGNAVILFRANRANIGSLWCLFNHITALLIQPRQTGKSLEGDALDAYMTSLGMVNSDISLLTKDDKLRAKTAKAVKEVIEHLPEYAQTLTSRDVKNSERMTIKLLKNVYNLYVGQADPKAADNLGRGMVTPCVRIDEICYVRNMHVTLPVLLSATVAARETAEEAGAYYYTFFTTTAGKLHTKEGKFMYGLYNGSVRWSEKFLDIGSEKKLKDMMRVNDAKYEIMLFEFNHRQLGYSDEWLRNRLKTAVVDDTSAKVDYLLEWAIGSSSSPISDSLLQVINKSNKPIVKTFISEYMYVLDFYTDYELIRVKTMILGLDTSDALGGTNDDIGLVIRDPEDGSVIACGIYNETNLTTFASFLVELLEKFPNLTFIPERRSSASAILDSMFLIMTSKNMNPYKRIFNMVVNNLPSDKNSDTYKIVTSDRPPSMDHITKNKRHFGYATSGTGATSRGLLYGNVFRSSIKYTSNKVHDKRLIHQLSSLILKNGRIDHPSGENDDLVISWLLTFWFLQYAKNKKIYGIDSSKILNFVINNEVLSENMDVDKSIINEQSAIKANIEKNINLLKATDSDITGLQIINRIMKLYTKLDTTIIRSFNIDVMLEDIKMYKKLSKRYKLKLK